MPATKTPRAVPIKENDWIAFDGRGGARPAATPTSPLFNVVFALATPTREVRYAFVGLLRPRTACRAYGSRGIPLTFDYAIEDGIAFNFRRAYCNEVLLFLYEFYDDCSSQI
ncbi:hypothetical protein EVAR_56027_1 [Eumeta japonica]|uniref:Uncharacterized protein n=1 Tax=Eumeta variegata TaxID=151549 RepID=A0A4C1YP75_EUMVA|nr:hypothetical protein EVAR_56027_1 [Eumeta japonica]